MVNDPMMELVVSERFLRKKEVARRIGVDGVTLWNWSKQGKFPMPYQLNPGANGSPIAWKESEVDEWMASRQQGFSPGPSQAWAGRRRAAQTRREERLTL
jgi:predicted DNA-binding transcriptional regulator AlpA